MDVKIIIGIGTATVGSAILQRIMGSIGKVDEAQWLDLTTKSGIVITAVTAFSGAVKAIAGI